MTVSDADLRYETHIGLYRQHGHKIGDPKRGAYWLYQAQHQHCLCVIAGIGDIQMHILSIGQQLEMGLAYHHLVFGAVRRSRMIWGALRQLYALIPPDREDPMPQDDVIEASRALNDIYIHTLGMLDNYAWAIRDLFGNEELRALHQNDVSLFSRRYRNNPSVSDFGEIASEFSDWNREIKERRDPVAHRIPLSVPPAILNGEDRSTYAALSDEANASQSTFFEKIRQNTDQAEIDAASDRWNDLMDRMARLGTFVPMIVHDPQEGGTRIYPTVPEDLGMLLLLSRQLNARLARRLNE